jgi:hypothetical protein
MKFKLFLVLLAFAITVTWAQPSGKLILDGSISEEEYKTVEVKNDFTIAARLSDDKTTLYAAIQGPTTGWISIGIGTLKMNGSFMTLGYVADGKPAVSFELGKGYSHAPTPAPGAVAFVSESNGITMLELSLPALSYVKNGILQVIVASGPKDDFKSKHTKRAALELKL